MYSFSVDCYLLPILSLNCVIYSVYLLIVLRDNGAEDGDYVTLSVNGKVYAPRVFLKNSGNSVLVPLNPGANLVQIYGDRDGGGGVTLAADVSSQGNMTSSAFPEGATALPFFQLVHSCRFVSQKNGNQLTNFHLHRKKFSVTSSKFSIF